MILLQDSSLETMLQFLLLKFEHLFGTEPGLMGTDQKFF